MIGIISGHDIEEITKGFDEIEIETRYGNVKIKVGECRGKDIVFLNRHQKNLPPHSINYLANIEALKLSNVKSIISVGTVGAIKSNIKPGSLVIPDDFIDFTKNRIYSFFNYSRIHIDLSEPFCPYIRKVLIETCKNLNVKYHDRGVYLCTEGPRLETKAEIRLFSKYADIVGMTLIPEAILSREKEMCYAMICSVCNMASGLQDKLSAREIKLSFSKGKKIISDIVEKSISKIEEDKDCACRHAMEGAKL